MREQALGAGLLSPTLRSLPDFRLYRPETLAEVDEVLRAEDELVVAAGCSDLVAAIREGLPIPAMMSIRRTAELQQITHRESTVSIGSAVTHHQGARSPALRLMSGLTDAWAQVATVRIRYAGTVGGNLLARRYRYEMPILIGALGGQLVFRSGAHENIEWLWHGTVDSGHRLLERIDIPTEGLEFFGYERSMRPITTVALAIRRATTGLNVTAAIGSEYRPTYFAHVSTTSADPAALPLTEVASALADQLPAEASDYAGSHSYRTHLVAVLAERLMVRHRDYAREREQHDR